MTIFKIRMAIFGILFLAMAATTSAQSNNPKLSMQTSKGTIVIELDQKAAPKTVANFLAYVRNGHYDGTIFHRVIKGFMIQGGGFNVNMAQKATQPPVTNEADNGLKNDIGTIAMARTSDPHSATSQFFINTADNAALNHQAKAAQGWGYCVFGKVIEGLEIVRTIENSPTTMKGGHEDVPADPVTIQHLSVVEAVDNK